MNKQAFEKGMLTLTAAFPSARMNAKLFFLYLQDLTDEQFEAAVHKVVATQVELHQGTNLVALIRHRALEEKFPSMGEAWLNVCECAKVIRFHPEKVKWTHPIVEKAAETIGLYEFETSESPQMTRAHFFRIYEEMVRAARENWTTLKSIPQGLKGLPNDS